MSTSTAPTRLPSAALTPASLAEVTVRLAETAGPADQAGTFPHESIAIIHGAGLLTATVGKHHGGDAIGHHDLHRLMLALGQGDPSAALITAMTLAFHARQATTAEVPEYLYTEILRASATAPVLVNSLQVEPALGTPSRGGIPATTARRFPGGWRVDGHKIYSTGSTGLSWMLVLAATDESSPRVGTFAIRGTDPGISIVPSWDNIGMRASCSHDVILTSVFVPDEQVWGLEAPATRGPVHPSGPGTALPSIYLGVAYAAREWFVRYLRDRSPSNLGASLLTLPRFETLLGEIDLELAVAAELLSSVAARADRGETLTTTTGWIAKTAANRAAISSVQRMVAAIGNPGLSRANPLERHLRDVLSSRVHFPQEDTVISALGRAAVTSATTTDPADHTSQRRTLS